MAKTIYVKSRIIKVIATNPNLNQMTVIAPILTQTETRTKQKTKKSAHLTDEYKTTNIWKQSRCMYKDVT